MRPPDESASDTANVLSTLRLTDNGILPSVFPVTALAVASIATAAQALSDYMGQRFGHAPPVAVDGRMASFWFASSLRPQGWQVPAARNPMTGDYATRDGWIRLHANAPHHRDAALAVLGCPPDPHSIRQAVSRYAACELEDIMVAAGACAAAMRSPEEWAAHPQGRAARGEPVFSVQRHPSQPNAAADNTGTPTHSPLSALSGRLHNTLAPPRPAADRATPDRPLAGLRVLDLTRVLSGPVCTRFLAGYGADVLRIDPPFWTEPGMVPEVTLGKRCAGLDLRISTHLARLRRLMADADVLVHGYRPGALARLGLGQAERQAIRPGLVDVCLNAYGWTGPWRQRRGFDSLVQMSCGIAWAGRAAAGLQSGNNPAPHAAEHLPPIPLPVQALDQATGYLMAAAVLRGLSDQMGSECGSTTQLSLARTAWLLMSEAPSDAPGLTAETELDLDQNIEATGWGPARRLRPPCTIEDVPMYWDYPAAPLRTHTPVWQP